MLVHIEGCEEEDKGDQRLWTASREMRNQPERDLAVWWSNLQLHIFKYHKSRFKMESFDLQLTLALENLTQNVFLCGKTLKLRLTWRANSNTRKLWLCHFLSSDYHSRCTFLIRKALYMQVYRIRQKWKCRWNIQGPRNYPTVSGTILSLPPYSLFCLHLYPFHTDYFPVITLPPVWHKRSHVANQLESLLKHLVCEDKLCYNLFSPLSTYCVIPSSVPIKTPWVLCSIVSYAAPITAGSCPLQCCTKQRDEHLSYVVSFIFTTGVFAEEQLALDLSWSVRTHNCVQADRSTKSYDKNGQKKKIFMLCLRDGRQAHYCKLWTILYSSLLSISSVFEPCWEYKKKSKSDL